MARGGGTVGRNRGEGGREGRGPGQGSAGASPYRGWVAPGAAGVGFGYCNDDECVAVDEGESRRRSVCGRGWDADGGGRGPGAGAARVRADGEEPVGGT